MVGLYQDLDDVIEYKYAIELRASYEVDPPKYIKAIAVELIAIFEAHYLNGHIFGAHCAPCVFLVFLPGHTPADTDYVAFVVRAQADYGIASPTNVLCCVVHVHTQQCLSFFSFSVQCQVLEEADVWLKQKQTLSQISLRLTKFIFIFPTFPPC